jgi:hypothetical protein
MRASHVPGCGSAWVLFLTVITEALALLTLGHRADGHLCGRHEGDSPRADIRICREQCA